MESKEEQEAIAELFAMTPEQIKLVPHEVRKLICSGKNCNRFTRVLDFGLGTIYWHKHLHNPTAGKHHWFDTRCHAYQCARHYKIFKRLSGKYSREHIDRKFFDYNKQFIIN